MRRGTLHLRGAGGRPRPLSRPPPPSKGTEPAFRPQSRRGTDSAAPEGGPPAEEPRPSVIRVSSPALPQRTRQKGGLQKPLRSLGPYKKGEVSPLGALPPTSALWKWAVTRQQMAKGQHQNPFFSPAALLSHGTPFSTPPPPLSLGGSRDPPCATLSGCCFFTGPWTVTRSSLRMLRRVAAFCRPLRPVLLLVSFPRSQSSVVGVPGLCWMWRDVPFARQRRPIVGVLRDPPPPPPRPVGAATG